MMTLDSYSTLVSLSESAPKLHSLTDQGLAVLIALPPRRLIFTE